MSTNEEYLDNLLKAFEEEEKAREKEVKIPQEKTIIEDKETYEQDSSDEVIKSADDSTPIDDIADLMSMLGVESLEADMKMETFPEDVPADDIADLMSILGNDTLLSESVEDESKIQEDLSESLTDSVNAEIPAEVTDDVQEDILADVPADDIADLMSMLGTDSLTSEETEEINDNDWAGDLDELLAAAVDKLDENNDFFSSAADASISEDMDITQLIDGLDNTDESLSEISELLKKSDNNEMFTSNSDFGQDDAISELIKENSEEKGGKKNRKNKTIKEKKEPGALGRFWKNLLEEEEEEKQENNATEIEEGDELLKQLDNENKKENKNKKEKNKKEKKNKKGEQNQEDGAEDNLDGIEEPKKKKKREKKQKVKIEKISIPNEKSKKVLSKKSFMVLIAFCASVIAIIVCLSAFVPDYADKRQAREAFYHGDYETAHVLLYGKNLNESDQLILSRVTIVLQLERKIEAYYFNEEVGKKAIALDALMQGITYYQELPDKNVYGAGDELRLSYQKILDILGQKYGVDENTALEVIAEDDIRYSQWIYLVAEGMEFKAGEEEKTEEILPEEEAIIKTENTN